MWTGTAEGSPDGQKTHVKKRAVLSQKEIRGQIPFQTAQEDIRHGQHAAGGGWVKILKHENKTELRG